ncbi:MAG TPA: hypothetical protein VH105_23060 [Burkholderiales bacterium]|nr:hypothetical protein [Burkholderiales bacterium]
MSSDRLVKLCIIGSLLLIALGWYMADHLPAPEKLSAGMLEEPEQRPTRDKPFDTNVSGVQYTVAPRFTYDISGLVVSLHHSDAWWDYAHKEWNDHINIADLCVVWGENVRRDAYRQASYTHTQWECWWQTGALPPGKGFDGTALSNNHVVTNDAAIAHVLREVKVGDEVRMRGYLIDYTTYTDGRVAGMRKTSIVRTDDGEGACEVVWVQELEIVRSHGHGWRVAEKVGAALLVLALIAWILLPAKLDD